MSKHKKSRFLILLFLSLGVLTVMIFSTLPEKPVRGVSSAFSVLLRPFERLFSESAGSVSSFFRALSENRELRAENARLKSENVDLRLRIKDNEQAAQAYAELKQAFGLKDRYPARQFLAANILQRPLEEDYQYLRLDVGSSDGLQFEEGGAYAVVDERARLLGRVDVADAISSMLLPLGHPGFSVNARAEKDAEHSFLLRGAGRVEGRLRLRAEQIEADCAIQVGDSVYCSGKGGLFPEGILCGSVVSVSEADALGQRTAEIEAAADPEQLQVVFILLPRDSERLPETEQQSAAETLP